MAAADQVWLRDAFAAWQFTAREKLKLGAPRLPEMIFFDSDCVYRIKAGQTPPVTWFGFARPGDVTLPDGRQIPRSVIAFAAPSSDGAAGYFTMALPSIWKANGVTSGLGIEVLTQGVLLHELMHAYQFYFANPALAELGRRYGLPDDISDDSLQQAFTSNADYVAAYEKERDLLYRAAAAPSDKEARALASDALAAMRMRRARFLTATNEKWAALDEIFLTMEGLGQWTIYAWLTDAHGRALAPAAALTEVRRGGKYWTQDEGLALFLVIDRLVPGWQKHAFAAKPDTAEALLARASEGGKRADE